MDYVPCTCGKADWAALQVCDCEAIALQHWWTGAGLAADHAQSRRRMKRRDEDDVDEDDIIS